jgi:hypothetical protein
MVTIKNRRRLFPKMSPLTGLDFPLGLVSTKMLRLTALRLELALNNLVAYA